MIEQGIVELVQSDPAVATICPQGGFMVQLPDGQALPSWAYTIISSRGDYCLDGTHGYTDLRLQVDCFATLAKDAVRLARAILKVLDAYHGTLPDPDKTIVFGCFQSDTKDFFNDAARDYRRMLEFEIQFSDTLLAE
jgi:hypothetical protein